jgi:hypothetical protein
MDASTKTMQSQYPRTHFPASGNPDCAAQDHTHSKHAPPAELQITPLQLDSLQSLSSQVAEALTGASWADLLALHPRPPWRTAAARPRSTDTSARPRALASLAPSAHGDGWSQHSQIAQRRSQRAQRRSQRAAGALIVVSVSLLMQHENGGY